MLNGRSILELPETAAFLTHFGINIEPLTDPNGFIKALHQLDPRYQGGRDLVRWKLENDQTQWPTNTIKVIMDAAKALGLLKEETPLEGSFGLVIALGGARQAPLDRLRYAAAAVNTEQTNIIKLVIAGSIRALSDAEKKNVANYAPGADTEADLCHAAATTVVRETGLIINIVIVENEKAGTPEVIERVISVESPLLKSIAVVTTQIYQPAVALDLARIARRYGINNMMAAGNPSDPAIVAKRTTATYLSEVLRTLRAAVLEATS